MCSIIYAGKGRTVFFRREKINPCFLAWTTNVIFKIYIYNVRPII